MRFNEKQLINLSLEKPDFEGRLHYKKVWVNYPNSKGFKERWFKLKSNILFYFKLNDTRQLYSKQPSGLFILEDSEVNIELNSETAFTFSITFRDELDRKHLFAARTDADVVQWMNAIKEASYGNLRNKLNYLQEKLRAHEKMAINGIVPAHAHSLSSEQIKNSIEQGNLSSTVPSDNENIFNLIQL